MIAPPLSVEPVNVTFATSASLTRCAPASLPPDRILTTPAGTTSLISSPRRNVVRGVEGAVLTTIVLPAHKAGAILLQRSEEHTSELQYLMRSSYAVFCLKQTTRS